MTSFPMLLRERWEVKIQTKKIKRKYVCWSSRSCRSGRSCQRHKKMMRGKELEMFSQYILWRDNHQRSEINCHPDLAPKFWAFGTAVCVFGIKCKASTNKGGGGGNMISSTFILEVCLVLSAVLLMRDACNIKRLLTQNMLTLKRRGLNTVNNCIHFLLASPGDNRRSLSLAFVVFNVCAHFVKFSRIFFPPYLFSA